MSFVGKEFLSMAPPRGYKPGVGRGAVPISANGDGRVHKKPDFPRVAPKEDRHSGDNHPTRSSTGRKDGSVDGEEDALAVYDSIEAKLKKRRRVNKNSEPATTNAASLVPTPAHQANERTELTRLSMDEWAQIPDAADVTKRSKRLREEERMTRRSYAVPDTLIAANEDADEEAYDTAKTRMMLETLIKAKPREPEGYLGLARLEEKAMRPKRARAIIERASLRSPQSVEVWLESIRLHPNSTEARAIAAKACQAVPTSPKIWSKLIDLEPTKAMKLQAVHEALLQLPENGDFWALAADLEPDSSTKELVLRSGIEYVPKSSMLWMALYRVTDSTTVLAEARQHLPADFEIWLALANRADHEDAAFDTLVRDGIEQGALKAQTFFEFLKAGGELPEPSEKARKILAALHVEPLDLSSLDLSEATLNMLYALLPVSEELYLQWALHNPAVLAAAVKAFPGSKALWIQYFSTGSDIAEPLSEIGRPPSEVLGLIAGTFIEHEEFDKVLQLLEGRIGDDQTTWIQFATAAVATQHADAKTFIDDGLAKWPGTAALYLLRAKQDAAHAEKVLSQAVKEVPRTDPNKPDLWLALADEAVSSPVRRRAVLSQATAEQPHSGELWLARIALDREEKKPYAHLLASALQNAPTFGRLWWEELRLVPATKRTLRLVEAVKASKGDVDVMLAGVQHFIAINKQDKAKQWLMKAAAQYPRNADTLLWMYRLGIAPDTTLERIASGQANEGSTWARIRRDACVTADAARIKQTFIQAAGSLSNIFTD